MSAALSQPEARLRAGLGDLPDRLRRQACTIAYMGASVTAQQDGYRPRLHALVRQATGHHHKAIGAGFGAMGSISGVFLMDELVLPHRPDLAFVEYATSDVAGTTPFELVGAALEGIVGKLRGAGCEPCFLYLHRRDVDPRSCPVIRAYEEVADLHGVPSVDVASWILGATERGSLPEGSVLRDLVHTTDEGSTLTAGGIWHALERIPSLPRPERVPLRDESLLRTRIVQASPALLRDGSLCTEGSFRLVFPYLEIDSSNELSFVPEGDLVGLLLAVGPHSGYIELEAGGARLEYLLWDKWCSYERLGSVVFTPFPRAGEHVRIRLLDHPVDYSGARQPVVEAESIEKRLKLLGLLERA